MLDQLARPHAAKRVMKMIMHATGTKMKSRNAGKLGYATSEVGDLVCEAL